MSGAAHTYAVLDIFHGEKYHGDQLAVVKVGNVPIAPDREQKIAREFGFVTTAFLHNPKGHMPTYEVELYSPRYEHVFSARALLGVAHYIFRSFQPSANPPSSPPTGKADGKPLDPKHKFQSCLVRTKYAEIQARYDPARHIAAIEIPHDCHVHGIETTKDEVLAVQRKMGTHPQASKMKASYPIFSLSKGFTYTLVDFTDTPQLLRALAPGQAPDPEIDEEWKYSPEQPGNAVVGAVYYVQLQTDYTEEPYITRLEVRCIKNNKEEAASASACCAIAAYISLQKPETLRHAYAFEQGAHVGRQSQLCVDVQLEPSGRDVASITLSGRAAYSMEGKLL